MNYTKQQLVEILIPALVKSTANSPNEVRAVLETYEVDGLEKELARQRKLGSLRTPDEDPKRDQEALRQIEAIRAEAREQVQRENLEADTQNQAESEAFYRDYYLDQISRVIFRGKRVVMNEASARLIESWLNPGESLNAEWFIKMLTEQPSLADQLQWRSASVDQNVVDRDTFSQAARQFQVSENIANFNLVCQALGEGFKAHDIRDVAGLSPATGEEIEEWNRQAAEERQDFLINRATPNQLKIAAREESVSHQQASRDEQARLQLEAQQHRESVLGFPPMPSDITLERIKAALPSELKFWMKKYGNYQLNARLAGKE